MAEAVAKVVPQETAPSMHEMQESTALISMIERAARDPNVDIVKMERLFEMQQKAEDKRNKAAFLAALSGLQADLPAAVRKGKGHNDRKYARFEDVTEALRPQLKLHGFSLTYRIKQTEKSITVVGVLGHARGHSEETEITLPADTSGSKNGVQAWASSVSYGKRYVALTLTGIATDDDDDGVAAGAPKKEDLTTISDAQHKELTTLIAETATDLAKFLDYGKIESLSDITVANFPSAKQMLLAKKTAMAKTKASDFPGDKK